MSKKHLFLAFLAGFLFFADLASSYAQGGPPVRPSSTCKPKDNLPQLCKEAFFTPGPGGNFAKSDPDAVSVSVRSCELANQIAGRPGKTAVKGTTDRCWVCQAIETAARSADALIVVIPSFLVCNQPGKATGKNGKTYGICETAGFSGLFIIFLSIAGIVSLYGILIGIVKRQPPVQEYVFLAKVLFAFAIIWAIANGFASTLWEWAISLLNIATIFSNSIRKIGGSNSSDWVCQDTLLGWENITAGLYGQMQGAAELFAAVVAMSWTILPDFDILGGAIDAITSFGTSGITIILRVIVTVTIVTTMATMVLLFLVSVVEALIYAAFPIAISPVLIFLSLFKGTKNSLIQGFAAVAYGFFALAIIGVSLSIASATMSVTIYSFNSSVRNDEVIDKILQEGTDQDKINHIHYTDRICDASNFSDLPRPWPEVNQYLCYYASNRNDLAMTNSRGHSYAWIIPALFLVIGVVIGRALAKYIQASATEFSGFTATSAGESITQQFQQIGGQGMKGIGRLGGALK